MTQPIEPFVPVDPKRFDYAGDAVEFRARLDSIEECLKALTAALASPQPAGKARGPSKAYLESLHSEIKNSSDIVINSGPYSETDYVSPQPAQEVDPIRELLAKAFEADNCLGTAKAIRNGDAWNVVIEALRTGIADLVKPVEDHDVGPVSIGGGPYEHGSQVARALRAKGLRIIKEPGL